MSHRFHARKTGQRKVRFPTWFEKTELIQSKGKLRNWLDFHRGGFFRNKISVRILILHRRTMYDIDLDLLSEARCELLALKHKTDFFTLKFLLIKIFLKYPRRDFLSEKPYGKKPRRVLHFYSMLTSDLKPSEYVYLNRKKNKLVTCKQFVSVLKRTESTKVFLTGVALSSWRRFRSFHSHGLTRYFSIQADEIPKRSRAI